MNMIVWRQLNKTKMFLLLGRLATKAVLLKDIRIKIPLPKLYRLIRTARRKCVACITHSH